MASITDYTENAWLNHLLRNTALGASASWCALFKAALDPTDSTAGTEMTGGSYSRLAITWSAASSRQITTTADLDFLASGSAYDDDVSAVGIYDASTLGNMLAYVVLAADITIGSGETLQIATGNLTISFASGGMGNYAVHEMLDHTFRNLSFTSPTTVYSTIYTAAPSDSGGGTQATGGTYARQSTTFAAPSGGSCASNATVSWTDDAGWGTITSWGLHDAAAVGTDQLIFYDTAFTEGSAVLTSGDTFQITSGSMTCSLT